MCGVLSIERARREPSWRDGTDRCGQRCASQSSQAEGAGSVSAESGFDSNRVGYCSESAQGCGEGSFYHSDSGVDAAISRACGSASEAESAGIIQVGEPAEGLLRTTVLALLNFYRCTLSPAIPSSCRFYPTCSAYAYEAVSQWGVGRGIWLTLRRVARCRPFGSFGYDPVPQSGARSS